MDRETFAQDGDIASHLGHIMREVILAFQIVWDESRMWQHFKPLRYLP
jgi:hypothetical protein